MTPFLRVWTNRLQKFRDNPAAVLPFLQKRFYYSFIADAQLSQYKDFKYLTYQETINAAIDGNRSLVRFGDELFDMLQGIGLYFGNWRQKYSPGLAERLKEIISSEDPRLLVCFNPELILMTKKQFKEQGIPEQYQYWTNSKIFLKDYYHPNVTYGSALCFHPRYNTEINYKKLKDYFGAKHIIILTSGTERFTGIHLGKTTQFIEAPGSDAWESYDSIRTTLASRIKELNVPAKDILILASMGTAAKILVYDLMKEGYVAWDTGQFFDLASEKIKQIAG